MTGVLPSPKGVRVAKLKGGRRMAVVTPGNGVDLGKKRG